MDSQYVPRWEGTRERRRGGRGVLSLHKATLNEENRRKGYVKEMEFLCGYFFYIFAMKGQFFNKRNRYFMNIG